MVSMHRVTAPAATHHGQLTQIQRLEAAEHQLRQGRIQRHGAIVEQAHQHAAGATVQRSRRRQQGGTSHAQAAPIQALATDHRDVAVAAFVGRVRPVNPRWDAVGPGTGGFGAAVHPQVIEPDGAGAVSYTHLTLPTTI